MKAKPKKSTIFTDILRKGEAAGHKNRTKAASNWFRNTARQLTVPNSTAFIKNEREFKYFKRNAIMPGYLYMFVYDPRYKDTLPYYDAFPVVFPWRSYVNKHGEKGFIGINLHYLPPSIRASLMDKLYAVLSNDKMTDNTKLKISYDILLKTAGIDMIKPCVHCYLNSHVQSKFYKIPAAQWEIAAFLPTEDFHKASKEQVWSAA